VAVGGGAQRLNRWAALAALPLFWFGGCASPLGQAAIPPQIPGGPGLTVTDIHSLPGWADDHTAGALTALIRGCRVMQVMPPDQALGGTGLPAQLAGQAGLWQNACNGAADVNPVTDTTARSYFESYFAAYRIDSGATITGYFEPEYPGSKNLARDYKVPLYAKPADAYLASLPRAAIDNGALYRKAPVTAYLADPVDAFMLQIQGSGRVLLPNGDTLRVGFGGQNGQPYTPIGRILVADGDLAASNVSFQTISTWLKDNPDQAKALMEQNNRYVFLRPLGPLPDDEGAPGTLGVPLTAGRSLAVDKTDIPLGAPVFIVTTNPTTNAPMNRLTIAQDTGGGINGAGEAELFCGAGLSAGAVAGRMRQPGTLYLFLPRPIGNS
jgi:membrane-bound lytic murein transglycosylase A